MISLKFGNGEEEDCVMFLYCDNIIVCNLKIEILVLILVWFFSDSFLVGRFKIG